MYTRNGQMLQGLVVGEDYSMVHGDCRRQFFAGCLDLGQLQRSTPYLFLPDRNRYISS